MLTKNAEKLLKKLVNNDFKPTSSSNRYFSLSEIFEKSPLNSQEQTNIALNEILKEGYISMYSSDSFSIETSGFTYSELKFIEFKNKIIWNIVVPLILGFIGGTIPVWFNAVIKWLL
ncbi:unnamed protein product [Fructobacillus cardui]|uniref:hypothetical protein n=1 Tax=Fructobacillus cardui TaxID=2893170 RepID=UPI002D8A5A13|nr:unnamed protein product [Fructobacillus cardui]